VDFERYWGLAVRCSLVKDIHQLGGLWLRCDFSDTSAELEQNKSVVVDVPFPKAL